MKITRVKPIIVNAGNLNWVFVKVETSTPGLYGWGEASLEWKPQAVVGAIADMTQLCIGLDPRRVEHVWQTLYRHGFYRGGAVVLSAISGIDMACWDILGKSLSTPVYQLLGGAVRDKVRCYGHTLTPPSKRNKKNRSYGQICVDAISEHGLTGLKLSDTPVSRGVEGPAAVRRLRSQVLEARKAVGDKVDLMLDIHGRATPAMGARYGQALEDIGLLFLEEPVLPYSANGMKKVAEQVRIPIAAGERLMTRYEFVPYLEAQALDVLQPDPSHCGGISETRKIGVMAEAYYSSMAPHNPLGPINTQACLHLDMAMPNFLIQEVLQWHVPWRDEIVSPPLRIENGYTHPGNRPGMGIEVNEKVCAEHPYKEGKHMQVFHEDGAVADW
jgi:galactonate dehydratase